MLTGTSRWDKSGQLQAGGFLKLFLSQEYAEKLRAEFEQEKKRAINVATRYKSEIFIEEFLYFPEDVRRDFQKSRESFMFYLILTKNSHSHDKAKSCKALEKIHSETDDC